MLKKLRLIYLFVLFAAVAQAQNDKGSVIEFEVNSHDFGDLEQGAKVEYVFKFKNTGTEPLVLTEVLTTCGCTAPKWNKEPVAPGATGEIKIMFNSEGKMGRQNKTITVVSNSKNSPARLSILCNVLPKGSK